MVKSFAESANMYEKIVGKRTFTDNDKCVKLRSILIKFRSISRRQAYETYPPLQKTLENVIEKIMNLFKEKQNENNNTK